MKLGVIVSSYNRPQYLAVCLRALGRQQRPPDEVIVADDGSDPAKAERLREVCAASVPAATFVTHPHRDFRLAATRNLGVRAATADYLLFTDCDVVLGPEVLAVHAAAAKPGRFLVGDRAWLDEQATRAALERADAGEDFEALWRATDRYHLDIVERKFGRHQWQRVFHLAQRHKPQILGCHFSIHRRDLESVNGFDEQYVGWGYEDDDLSARLYMSGCSSRSVIRAARAIHLWHPSSSGSQDRRSPNRDYFYRAGMEMRCSKGLV